MAVAGNDRMGLSFLDGPIVYYWPKNILGEAQRAGGKAPC